MGRDAVVERQAVFARLRQALAVLLLAPLMVACAHAPQFGSALPKQKLELEKVLVGKTTGEGAFIDSITGDETRFSVVINGTWDGKVLTLVEDFNYATGVQERKTWLLTRTGEGTFEGVREDVIGKAAVYQDGPGVRLDYHVTLDTGIGGVNLRFQDLLYLADDGRVINQAVVSKFGLRVGRVDITMSPETRIR